MENKNQQLALSLIRELTALLCNRAWRDVENLRRQILHLGVEEIAISTFADMQTVRQLILQDRWRVDVRVARVPGREYEKIKQVARGPPRIHLYTDGVSPRNGLRKRGGESLRARLRRARKAGGYMFKGDGSGWKAKDDRSFAAAASLSGGWKLNKKAQPRKAGGHRWEGNGSGWKAKDDRPFAAAVSSSGGWTQPRKAGGHRWEDGSCWKAKDDRPFAAAASLSGGWKPQPRKETGIRIKEPQYAAPYRRRNNVADPREKGKGKVVEESSSDSSSD